MKASDTNTLTDALLALDIKFTTYLKKIICSYTQCQTILFKSNKCVQKLSINFEMYSFLKESTLTIEEN